MTLTFDLKALKEKHKCVNYFETGLWDPRSNVSSKQALAAGFEKVFCIELREQWIILGREVFEDEIVNEKYFLFHDDSVNMKNHLNYPCFENKTMFFLDAHVDNINIRNFKKICPVFDELEAIKSLDRKDNVIMVDDLRLLKQPFPWGEQSYGNINFVDTIKNKILEINPDYKFTTLEGHIADDILCAYVDE